MNRLMQLVTSIALVLILSFPALAASDYFEGWEHGDPAGWHPNTIQTDLVVMETGGNPGGFLHSSRSTDETFEIGADCQLPEVTGDYGEAHIEEVSLDLNFLSGDFTMAHFRVRYNDPADNGWYYQLAGPADPFELEVWQSYSIQFDPTWSDQEAEEAGWFTFGPPDHSFATTMSDVHNIEVRIRGRGALALGIDNFRLLATPPVEISLDIKPGSCPNPLNMKNLSSRGKAVLPVAILGTEDFEVSSIDPQTVTLEGISPIRWSLEDVSAAVDKTEDSCACSEDGPDGYDDLSLKFDRREIVNVIMSRQQSHSERTGSVRSGGKPKAHTATLVFSAILMDGTLIEGYDCVKLLTWGEEVISEGDGNPVGITFLGNHPNPFNPSTIITFALSEPSLVKLEIINVLGQSVDVLIDDEYDAGRHTIEWEGSGFSSGVYFYRISAGDFVQTKKMLLMK